MDSETPGESTGTRPGKIQVQFVLYQSQVWISRPTLVIMLKDRIKAEQDMLDISGPEYGKTHAAKIEALQQIIDAVKSLEPGKGEDIS